MQAEEAGPLGNTGVATAPNPDPDPKGAEDAAMAKVAATPARLTLRKRASHTEVEPGATADFVITVGAKPGSDARDVRICDRLPDGLRLVSPPGAQEEGRRLCWTIETLRAGTKRSFQVLTRVVDTSRLTSLTNLETASAGNAVRKLRTIAEVVVAASAPPPTTG